MKANELMIGDWVLWKNKPVQIARVSGVVYSFGHIDVTLAHCGDGILETHDIKSISAIPLTPEILKKNGFEYNEGGTGMYGVEIVPHYLRDDVPFEVFCDGEPFAIWFKDPINIKYVHQLQHALRLCGISKEIEL